MLRVLRRVALWALVAVGTAGALWLLLVLTALLYWVLAGGVPG